MASTPDLPDMLGSEALMQFLQDGLQQLEAGQGFADAEARGLLQQLQQQTAILQALAGAQQQDQQLTDIQLAEHIDSVDAQLAQLEAALGSADEATKQLLGQSASKWMTAEAADNHSIQQHSNSREQPTAANGNCSSCPAGQVADACVVGSQSAGGTASGSSGQQQVHASSDSNSSSEGSGGGSPVSDAAEGNAALVAEAAAAAAAAMPALDE